MERSRNADSAPSGAGLVLLAGLLAVLRWRPEWMQAAAVWYVHQCMSVATVVANGMIRR